MRRTWRWQLNTIQERCESAHSSVEEEIESLPRKMAQKMKTVCRESKDQLCVFTRDTKRLTTDSAIAGPVKLPPRRRDPNQAKKGRKSIARIPKTSRAASPLQKL
jgi:hypothetical protein